MLKRALALTLLSASFLTACASDSEGPPCQAAIRASIQNETGTEKYILQGALVLPHGGKNGTLQAKDGPAKYQVTGKAKHSSLTLYLKGERPEDGRFFMTGAAEETLDKCAGQAMGTIGNDLYLGTWRGELSPVK